jgi:hypothetical protein
VFSPEPGHVIVTADLSQIDACAIAAWSQDPGLHRSIRFQVWRFLHHSFLAGRRSISGEQKAEAEGGTKHDVEPDGEGQGLRDWFDGLPKVSDGAQAAASDTRVRSPMAGGAARGIARRLRRHGCQLVGDPEGFIVDDSHGPLRVGEIERAKHWGAQLVRADIRTAH